RARSSDRADYYDVAIQPERVLRVGAEVRLMLLSQARFHTPELPERPAMYDAYDIQVEGRIGRVAASAMDALTFVLENKYQASPIRYAYITIPNIHDITVHIDPNDTPRAAATLQPLHTHRTAWLEPDAVVSTWNMAPRAPDPVIR
ncbi:hypothetical protein K466DRAFT_438818, partial [Polyporus arcularius HHB13444]